ncbi:MAG: hypothetical protein QXD05_00170 [Candidatus Pacearchaeota archaeon]
MIKQNSKNEIKKIKIINKELNINCGDLDLYLDLFITDENGKTEKILTKKGDSILANFLRIMYLQMSRDIRNNVMGGTFYRYETTKSGSGIVSIGPGNNNKIRITFDTSILSNYPAGKVTLGGFQGVNIDGRYDFTRINNTTMELENSVYQSGWQSGTGGVNIYVPITNLNKPSYNSFRIAQIVIGTGTAAVAIDDQLLEKQIPSSATNGGLIYNNIIVSQDTNDANSAQITITRTFTNQASNTVQVNEIGMLMYAGSNSMQLLVMRDLIPSGVNVAAGKTLTVNYRIKTSLNTQTDPGGFVSNFMRILYRHVANSTRAAFDINNNNITDGSSKIDFIAVKAGGYSIEYPDDESEQNWKIGIIIGSGNASVSMGDYNLNQLIEHGKSNGKMLYYGGFAEDFETGTDYAQFKIIKAFENASGNTIQVNEYGLTIGAYAEVDGSDTFSGAKYIYLIARNVLSSSIDIQNGVILKVVYTLKVQTGGGS